MRKKDKKKSLDLNLFGYVMSTRNVKKSTPNGRRLGSDAFKQIGSKVETDQGTMDMTAKKERQKYTGSVVIGIAVMHKSNLVPVIDQKQAEECAKMRRG